MLAFGHASLKITQNYKSFMSPLICSHCTFFIIIFFVSVLPTEVRDIFHPPPTPTGTHMFLSQFYSFTAPCDDRKSPYMHLKEQSEKHHKKKKKSQTVSSHSFLPTTYARSLFQYIRTSPPPLP